MNTDSLRVLRRSLGRRTAAAIADVATSPFPVADLAWTATIAADSVPIGTGAAAWDADVEWVINQDGVEETVTPDPTSGSIIRTPGDAMLLIRPTIILTSDGSAPASVDFMGLHFDGLDDDEGYVNPVTLTDKNWTLTGPIDSVTWFSHRDCVSAFVPAGRDLAFTVQFTGSGDAQGRLEGLTVEAYPL